jgi:hypothetical protein
MRTPRGEDMRACIRGATALLAGIIAFGIAPVSAQTTPKPPPAFMMLFTAPPPSEAIQAPLSAKMADKLAQVWFDTADPACRASKSLDQATYQKLARTMIVAVGDHMRQLAASTQDGPKAEAQFAAQAGRSATEELQRLSNDPVVKQFLVLNRSRSAVEQTQTYLDNIERALLLKRVETRGRASPLATGDSAMLDEIEKVSSAPLDYVDANKTRAMTRLLDLMIIAERAVGDTSNRDELLRWGPGRLMVILEGPLKEYCVMKG